jgi:hypothetical protein
MRIGRTLVIPVIVVLSVAGSVLASAEMSAAAVTTPSAHVQRTAVVITKPDMRYHN